MESSPTGLFAMHPCLQFKGVIADDYPKVGSFVSQRQARMSATGARHSDARPSGQSQQHSFECLTRVGPSIFDQHERLGV